MEITQNGVKTMKTTETGSSEGRTILLMGMEKVGKERPVFFELTETLQ